VAFVFLADPCEGVFQTKADGAQKPIFRKHSLWVSEFCAEDQSLLGAKVFQTVTIPQRPNNVPSDDAVISGLPVGIWPEWVRGLDFEMTYAASVKDLGIVCGSARLGQLEPSAVRSRKMSEKSA